MQGSNVPEGYKPHVIEFFLPLGTLIGLAILTFVVYGSPNVHWAFGAALALAAGMALAKGMALKDLIAGFHDGIKGVVLGSVILLLAITIGGLSQQTGGGIFLVEQLGDAIPFFLLPVLLQIITVVIAFSTGTSWGTYAVAFPLAMPLAWAVATSQGLSHPELVHDALFRGSDGRQRLRRPMLTHLRHYRAQLGMHRLRPDGPREDPNPAGFGSRDTRRHLLDRSLVPHSLTKSGVSVHPLRTSWARRGAMDGQERRAPI